MSIVLYLNLFFDRGYCFIKACVCRVCPVLFCITIQYVPGTSCATEISLVPRHGAYSRETNWPVALSSEIYTPELSATSSPETVKVLAVGLGNMLTLLPAVVVTAGAVPLLRNSE